MEFKYRPTTKADAVYLAGGFNELKPTGHKMEGPAKDGVFQPKVKLKAGVHEYKFVIDGKTWRTGFYANSVVRIAPGNAAPAANSN